MSNSTDKKNKTTLLRVSFFYVIAAIVSVMILYKIWFLQFAEGNEWRNKANKITFKIEEVEAIRGDICDEDGSPIITSVQLYDIAFDTQYLPDSVFKSNIDSLAFGLNALFPNRSYASYKTKIDKAHQKKNRYLMLQRNINYKELMVVKELSMFRDRWLNGGLIVIPKQKRHKIYNGMAKRTLGYVSMIEGSDEKKYIGIEGQYNDYLKGEKGKRHVQKIYGGAYIPVNFKNQVAPKNGMDIITTIDVNVQDAAESSLKQQLQNQEADFGCAIVMEVETGYIKAMANIGNHNGEYIENYNYAVGRKMAPGSTLKTATILAALEDKKITDLGEIINTGNGKMKISGRYLSDSHRGGFGKIPVRQVLEKSSNIGTALLVNKYYKENPQEFLNRLKKFHLMDKTGIDIPGEPQPMIRQMDSKYWSRVSLPWLSFGYESEITPLQILTFYNAIANGGKMMKPQLVQKIQNEGKIVKLFDPQVIDNAIASKKNIDSIKIVLENVVKRGTATNLKDAPYSIAGKTGTAKIPQGKKGYNQRKYRASFVGYFPAEEPRYSIIVVVSNPKKGSYYGNRAAGNVFKEIGNKIYAKHIDIPSKNLTISRDSITHSIPTYVIGNNQDISFAYKSFGIHSSNVHSEWIISLPVNDTIAFKERLISHELIPDFKGMNIKDALYIIEKMGIKYKVEGRGKIVKQSIKPGTKLNKNQRIILKLS